MSRDWLLTKGRHYCGRCGRTIRAGEIALRLTLPASRIELWRCSDCDPVPADVVAVNEAEAIAESHGNFAERLKALVQNRGIR